LLEAVRQGRPFHSQSPPERVEAPGAMLGPACFAPLVTLAKNKIGWYDSVLNFRGDVGQPGRRVLRIGFEYNRSFCSSSIFYKSIGADSSILIAGLPSFPISPTSFPEVVY
jgi:hypothetical protein